MLPLNGSEFAAEALPHAEEIARSTEAKLILFQVVVDPATFLVAPSSMSASGGSTGLGGGGVGVVSIHADDMAHTAAMDDAKRYLDDLAERLKHRKVDTEVDIATIGTGPAGLAAATYTLNVHLNVALIAPQIWW